MPMLKVFGEDIYQDRVGQVMASGKTAMEQRELLGIMAMRCREVLLDCRGRLLIPNDIRIRLGVAPGSEVILAGLGSHFEIWNMENFDALQKIQATLLENDELGIL